MDQGGADQPGHEGGVFYGVPEPPAAPAEFVVGPFAAEGNPDGEEHPGDGGPGAGPAGPFLGEFATEQGGDGEAKGDGEANVAHVEDRGVEDHAGVLQQGVEVPAVKGGGDEPVEGVGGEQDEGDEADADEAHGAEQAGAEYGGQVAAEDGDGNCPQGEGHGPEQHGAFVATPDGRQAVLHGQGGVGVGGNIQHGEVVGVKGVAKTDEGDAGKHKLPSRGRDAGVHPGSLVARSSSKRKSCLRYCQQQCKYQRKLT